MKIFISIILMTVSTNLYPQVSVSGKMFEKGEIVRFKENERFLGKFVWKKGAEVFTLVLKKEIYKAYSDNPFEMITGTYDYAKDGKTIYSYANNPVKYGNLSGMVVIDDKLDIAFTDGTTGANAKGYLAFNNEGNLIWKIAEHSQGIKFIGYRKDLSVPTEMILEEVPN